MDEVDEGEDEEESLIREAVDTSVLDENEVLENDCAAGEEMVEVV